MPHGDVDVLEPRGLDVVGHAHGSRLHLLADVEQHLAASPLQGGDVQGLRLAAGDEARKGLAGVGDARDGVEEFAHGAGAR